MVAIERCDKITEAGLLVLRDHPGLKQIYFKKCAGITPKGVAELRKAHPALKVIIWEDPNLDPPQSPALRQGSGTESAPGQPAENGSE